MQNGNGTTAATCDTADALSLPLTVSGIGTLGTTNIIQSVTLNVTHTWNSDVVLSLQDPSGTVIVLLADDKGGNGDGFANVVLIDGAPALPVENMDLTGNYAPDESFAAFNAASISADGDWVLLVCDDAGGDVGSLDDWSITFAPAPTCSNPASFTATPVTATTADLAWTQVGSVSLWDIELVDITAAGAATGTATSTGVSNPTTLSGLTAENDYEVYVRADCLGDGVSSWVGPIAFTTPVACDVINGAPLIDDLTDVSIDFSWTAPATGTPVGYNWEIVEDGTGQGGTILASGSTAGTTASSGDVLTLDTTYNVFIQTDCGVADGTSVWAGPYGFTTQPGPEPANNDCAGAISIVQETDIADVGSATPTAGSLIGATASGVAAEVCNGFTGTANDDVWYSFEALTTNVNITFEINFDGIAELYSGTCGALTVIDCADNTITTAPIVEEINATGLTAGTTYYVRIFQYSTGSTSGLNFDVKLWSSDTLGTDEFDNENAFTYFPNPVKNELTLNAQKDIQNVSVYNMLGQEVLRTAPNATDSTINMNELSQGAYFVQVTIGNVVETVRIIKQ